MIIILHGVCMCVLRVLAYVPHELDIYCRECEQTTCDALLLQTRSVSVPSFYHILHILVYGVSIHVCMYVYTKLFYVPVRLFLFDLCLFLFCILVTHNTPVVCVSMFFGKSGGHRRCDVFSTATVGWVVIHTTTNAYLSAGRVR